MRNSMGNKVPEIPDLPEIPDPKTVPLDPGTDITENLTELEIRNREIELDEKEKLSRIRVTIARTAASIGGAVLIVILVHYLGPASWHWLTDDQLGKIETVLGGSGITALILTSARKYL